MNLSTILMALDGLSSVVDNNVAGLAIALKQALELTARHPDDARALDQIISQSPYSNRAVPEYR